MENEIVKHTDYFVTGKNSKGQDVFCHSWYNTLKGKTTCTRTLTTSNRDHFSNVEGCQKWITKYLTSNPKYNGDPLKIIKRETIIRQTEVN